MTTCAKEGRVGDFRASYAPHAIGGLKHLRYDGPMRLHFADDGSRPGHREQLLQWGKQVRDWTEVTVTNAYGAGIGKSLNLALTVLHSDLVFFIKDDSVLIDELNLEQAARILENESIGLVRTGMIHPDLYAKTVYGGPELWGQYYWVFDKPRCGYVFSFRNWLAHRRFWLAYGPFPEGIDIYNTERIYNEHVRATEGPEIAFAGNVQLNHPWTHIGKIACDGKEA